MRSIVGCLLALVLVAPVPARADTTPGDASGRLRTDGDVLRDGEGREVILRGIAMILKSDPWLPDNGPADFARIRSWGLNSVRLGIHWRGLMPDPGVVDTAYLDGIEQLVDDATAAGLYVVVDMHQDLWGGGFSSGGAPDWATNTRNCPHLDFAQWSGVWQANYFSPAVACAFDTFWTDAGLQAHFASAWRAVAERVGANPRVVGYDLFNEPHPGGIPPGLFEAAYLYPSQARWLAAIREVHPDAMGFFEPPIYKNIHAPVAPGIGLPPGVVYAPHVYGLWDATDDFAQTRALARPHFESLRAEATAMGVPLWIGEFGVRHDQPGAAGFVRDVYDMADEAKAGAAYWEYALPRNNEYGPMAPDGTERATLAALVRAYPDAVAGTIRSFAYDADTRELGVTWAQTGPGTSRLQLPARLYPDGFTVTGLTGGAYDPATGLLTLDAGPGVHTLVVSPPPATL